jgi:bacteriocin biosynthesis cyclodehydratase domain-containing protein
LFQQHQCLYQHINLDHQPLVTNVENRTYYPLMTGIPEEPEWREIVAPVSGDAVMPLADALPSLLDGTRTLEMIYSSLLQQGYLLEAIPKALQWLEVHGLLRESPDSAAGILTAEEKLFYQAQTRAFAQLTEPRRTYGVSRDICAGWSEQARLKQSVVILFGLGEAGRALARALVQSGVGRIVAAPANPATENFSAEAFTSELHGINPHVEFLVVTAPEDIPVILGDVTPDLMLYCPDHFEEANCVWLNKVSLELKIPFLIYRQRTLEVDLGPLVFPGETACYVCYERRCAAVMASSERRTPTEVEGAHFRLAMGVDLLTLEIMKFLSGAAEPITRSRLWRLNLTTGITEIHPVLKLPRCPACGVHKVRPPRKLWEEL